MSRITARFNALKGEDRTAFISFITAGDPDFDTSLAVMKGLPGAGVDLIELGMPFSDPSADGPTIELASGRALRAGANMHKTLEMVRRFREDDTATPIVLMGYVNPMLAYGLDAFCTDAANAGADGLLIVDVPSEEDDLLSAPMQKAGLDLIKLATPTTDDARLKAVLGGASGFLYYVAVAGVTGQKSATYSDIEGAVARLKAHTDLPVAVGFGIKTPGDVAAIGAHADGVVVGSSVVAKIASGLDAEGKAGPSLVKDSLEFVEQLSSALRKTTAQ